MSFRGQRASGTVHGFGDDSGCRRLWAAVLHQVVTDAMRSDDHKPGRKVPTGNYIRARRAREQRHAAAWIGTRDFHQVCALAGVDGVAAADRLRDILDTPEAQAVCLDRLTRAADDDREVAA